MNQKEVLNNLRKMKQVQPAAEWKAHTKNVLMRQIEAQGVSEGLTWYQQVNAVFQSVIPVGRIAPVFRGVGAAAMAILVALSGGVYGVQAAEKSLPGDLLYTVKRTKERVRVSLTPSDEKKAQLHLSYAEKRIQEIEEIKNTPVEYNAKVNKIAIAVTDLHTEVKDVKETLARVEVTEKEPAKIIEVADAIDEKVEDVTEYLDKNLKQEVLNEGTDDEGAVSVAQVALDTVDEVIKEGRDTANSAVIILAKNKDHESVEPEVKEKIKEKVRDKIKKAQEEVAEASGDIIDEVVAENNMRTVEEAEEVEVVPVEESVAIQDGEQAVEGAEELAVEEITEAPQEEVVEEEVSSEEILKEALQEEAVKEVTTLIEEEPKKAEYLLNEAETLVESDDLVGAIEKVQATQNLVEEIKDKVDDIVKADLTEQDVEAPQLDESTPVVSEDAPEEVLEDEAILENNTTTENSTEDTEKSTSVSAE